MSLLEFIQNRRKLARRKLAKTQSIRSTKIGVLLAVLLWVVAFVLHFGGEVRHQSSLAVGQRAPATVIAAADFTCPDTARTELVRRQAADAILPLYALNMASYESAGRALDKLYERIRQVRPSSGPEPSRAESEPLISDALDLLGLTLTPDEALQLAPKGQEDKVYGIIKNSLVKTAEEGVLPQAEKESALQEPAGFRYISIRMPDHSVRPKVAVTAIPSPEKALQAILKNIGNALDEVKIPDTVLIALLQSWVIPNLVYDPVATDELRQQAMNAIEPMTIKVRIGTTLVERGERITPQILERLRAHEKRLGELETPYERLMRGIGSAGLLMGGMIICAGLLLVLAPKIAYKSAHLLLLAALSILTLLCVKGLLYLSETTQLISPAFVEFMLPLSLAPLLTTILVNGPSAKVLGFWNSFAAAVMFDNSFTIFAVGLATTVIASLSARDVRKRAHVFRAGLSIGLGQTFCVVCFAALNQQAAATAALQSLTGLLNGVLCAVIALMLLPLFEVLFGCTSGITLLELSDMGNPLLQRLAMEAPGTYHHSLVVSNLGQAAASRINANGLLVRVCAYFHDIGKLTKPEFYAENSHLRENPHDDLAPSMSVLVILSHVKDGISLLQKSGIPKGIAEGVEQHHGTSLISYFYHRARQLAEAGENGNRLAVNEEDFRYPGPKPQSREMAILMLADATEAASRSMEKPTPTRIESLVNEIAEAKLHDGQLDECDLTFTELREIKRSFVFTLTSMLHGRTAYPQNETQATQPTGKASATHAGHTAAQPMAAGPDSAHD